MNTASPASGSPKNGPNARLLGGRSIPILEVADRVAKSDSSFECSLSIVILLLNAIVSHE